MNWNDVQKHESDYWGNCLGMRAWGELVKQEMYGREMGLFAEYGDGHGELDMRGKSVVDVGGGPVSMTLRCLNAGPLVVVDPCDWPASALRRYKNYGIEFVQMKGEEIEPADCLFDEVWLYNVLQHTEDPTTVLNNLKGLGKVLRVFEWLWIETDECHPHKLTPELILGALSDCKAVKVTQPRLEEYWCNATALVGVFELPSK